MNNLPQKLERIPHNEAAKLKDYVLVMVPHEIDKIRHVAQAKLLTQCRRYALVGFV
jgi:hypothetical protein